MPGSTEDAEPRLAGEGTRADVPSPCLEDQPSLMAMTDIVGPSDPFMNRLYFYILLRQNNVCTHVCHLYLFLSYLLVLCAHFPLLYLYFKKSVGALNLL